MPDGGAFDAFMALELKGGHLGLDGGTWYADKVFAIDEDAFNEWNARFLSEIQGNAD
jgi:hypothetical protein